MINSVDAAFILNFVVVAGSIIYFVSKLEANTRANKEFYEQVNQQKEQSLIREREYFLSLRHCSDCFDFPPFCRNPAFQAPMCRYITSQIIFS